MKNPLLFLREVRKETRKITWANSKETLQGALVVLATSVVVAVFFLVVDFVVKASLRFLLNLGI